MLEPFEDATKIYALTGDDFRLLLTHQPADPVGNLPFASCFMLPQDHRSDCPLLAQVFDGLTLFCIVVFVLEIVLCMFAKENGLLEVKLSE